MQTDAVRARPKSRAALSLVLVLLLVAAPAPLSPAKATNHMPWDQPGSAWQGTITTDTSWVAEDEYSRQEVSHSATYTDLKPLLSSADGDYDAHLVAGGSEDVYGACDGKEGNRNHLFHYQWQLDTEGPNIISGTSGKLGLITNNEGQMFFAPWYQSHIPFQSTGYCTGDGVPVEESYPAYNGISKLGFVDGNNPGYSSNPLPDVDPDPLHLVGSKTWTVADPPVAGMFGENMGEYTFTVTYDLHLVISCPPPTQGDADGDRLPDGYETQVVGSDPSQCDTDQDTYWDALEVASGSSPINALETPDTLSSGVPPKNLVGQGDSGITCGRTKFRWVSPALKSLGVSAGQNGCILLISNNATNAVVDYALEHAPNITSALAAMMGPYLVEIYGEEAVDWVKEESLDTVGVWALKREVKSLILKALNLSRINSIYTVGKVAGLTGVAYGSLWALNQVRNKNACMQVRIGTTSTGRTKLSWSLVYSKENLTDEALADRLHEASVWKKKIVNNGFDKAVRQSINLRCDQGRVVASGGGAGKVFEAPVSFVF